MIFCSIRHRPPPEVSPPPIQQQQQRRDDRSFIHDVVLLLGCSFRWCGRCSRVLLLANVALLGIMIPMIVLSVAGGFSWSLSTSRELTTNNAIQKSSSSSSLSWLASTTTIMKPMVRLVVQDEVAPIMAVTYHQREFERVISGQGRAWERMYAFASIEAKTPDFCNGRDRAIPMFADGVAAGPLLCTTRQFSAVGQEAEHEAEYNSSSPDGGGDSSIEQCATTIHDLDAYQLLKSGHALRLALDPIDASTHANVVKDRERHSSASGVVFLDDQHFCVVSFGHSMLYLYHYNADTMQATLLDKVLNRFPGGQQGGEFTELIDYNGKDLLVTGNLRSSSTTLFRIDWATKKMHLLQPALVFADVRRHETQMTHGARFYPSLTNDAGSSSSSNIVVATAQYKDSPNSLMVRFYNWRKNRTVAELRMKDTRHAGMGPQDIFFIDMHNMLVIYTFNRITGRFKPDENCRGSVGFPNDKPFNTRLVHYRLDFDLDHDDDEEERTIIDDASKFVELQSIEYLHSHPDSMSYNNGIVVLSDQYLDQVNFVGIDPKGMNAIQHLGVLTGYHMNHGVALSPNMESVAVTQYGDNSVIINKFPPFLRAAMDRHRLSLNLPQVVAH
jgi:hypothetical protein